MSRIIRYPFSSSSDEIPNLYSLQFPESIGTVSDPTTALNLAYEFTLEAFIYPTSYGAYNIFGRQNTSYRWGLRKDGEGLEGAVWVTLTYADGSTQTFEAERAVPLNQWTEISVKRNAKGELVILYNLVKQGTFTTTDLNLQTPTAPFEIGYYTDSQGNKVGKFFGYMDELRIWNFALPLSMQARYLNQRLYGDEHGLVFYARGDDQKNQITDYAGNNNATAPNVIYSPKTASYKTPPECDIAIADVKSNYTEEQATGSIDILGNNLAGAGDHAVGWIDVISNTIPDETSETHTLTIGGDSVQVNVTSNISPTASESLDISDLYPKGIIFNPSGTRLYVIEDLSAHLFNLSTAWDIATASYSGEVVTFDHPIRLGVALSADGTKLYMTSTDYDGEQYGLIVLYNLSTPWDLSTASYSGQQIDITAQTGYPDWINFRDDGTQMYITSQDTIYSYDLSTPWDISTAAYSGEDLIYGPDDSPLLSISGTYIRPDGTQLFIARNDYSNEVYSYNLSTPWDISTATYSGPRLIINESIDNDIPQSILFDETGKTLYVYEAWDQVVYSYDLPDQYNLGIAIPEEAAASAYATAINSSLAFADWSASIEDNGDGSWRCLIIAKAAGTEFNDTNIDVVGETDVTLTTQNTHGGTDGEATHTITLGSHTTSPITVLEDDTKPDIAGKYAAAINNDPDISKDWLAAQSNNRCHITAKQPGDEWNGKALTVDGNNYVTIDINPPAGGIYIIDIEVSAISTHGPIEYQLLHDKAVLTPYNPSNIFSDISPGHYTIEIKDALDCRAETTFEVV